MTKEDRNRKASFFFRPSGAWSRVGLIPGLAPWATIFRPYRACVRGAVGPGALPQADMLRAFSAGFGERGDVIERAFSAGFGVLLGWAYVSVFIRGYRWLEMGSGGLVEEIAAVASLPRNDGVGRGRVAGLISRSHGPRGNA